jgi:hypothetical protein
VPTLSLRAGLTAVSAATLFAWAVIAQAQNRWVQVKGGTWKPGAELIVEMQARLEPYTRMKAKAQDLALRTWSEYTFQYHAIEEKGRRYVFVNALCHAERDRPLDKEIIRVRDGGTCFFNVKYDPKRRQYYDLVFNGEA